MARTDATTRGRPGGAGKPTSGAGARERDARGAGRPARTEDALPARWRTYAALALSIGGLGISVYLSIAHFAHVPLACSASGIINCARVTHSAESYFLGVPVAFWGLLFYIAMTVVNLPVAWRAESRWVHLARLAMVVGGMCFVLYLVSAELLIIKNICLWCTFVHAITFLLFVLTVATVPQMLGWGTTDGRNP